MVLSHLTKQHKEVRITDKITLRFSMLCVNNALCETICIEPLRMDGAHILAVGTCESAKLFNQYCGGSRLRRVGGMLLSCKNFKKYIYVG